MSKEHKKSVEERLHEFRRFVEAERVRYGNAVPVANSELQRKWCDKASMVCADILAKFDQLFHLDVGL